MQKIGDVVGGVIVVFLAGCGLCYLAEQPTGPINGPRGMIPDVGYDYPAAIELAPAGLIEAAGNDSMTAPAYHSRNTDTPFSVQLEWGDPGHVVIPSSTRTTHSVVHSDLGPNDSRSDYANWPQPE